MNIFTLTLPDSGSAVVIPHGLGSVPVVIAKLECQTDAGGFAEGDQIDLMQCGSAAGMGTLSVVADAVNITASAATFSQ